MYRRAALKEACDDKKKGYLSQTVHHVFVPKTQDIISNSSLANIYFNVLQSMIAPIALSVF